MPKPKASPYTVPELKSFSASAIDKAAEKLLAALKIESRKVSNEADWKIFRDRWISRNNGLVTQVNELWLKAAPKESKRDMGQRVNELRQAVESQVEALRASYTTGAVLKATSKVTATLEPSDRIDITLPGTQRPLGAEHPVIKTMNEIVSVFREPGIFR